MSEFIVITEHFEGSLLFGIAVLALFVIVPVLHNTLNIVGNLLRNKP